MPGIAIYAALYGLFHNGKAIAPEPPSANTLETVIVVAGGSIAVHTLTAVMFAFDRFACANICPITVPPAWIDPYASAIVAIDSGTIGGTAIALVLGGVMGQSLLAYGGVRLWLNRLARSDRLPVWIYGWATSLANGLDNTDTAVIAYVLTTQDHDRQTIVYGGLVHDIALRPDGCVNRITLRDAERYLVELHSPLDQGSLSSPLSRFDLMIIDAENIRNIAFEMLDLASVAVPDLLANGLRRIYAGR